MVSKLQKYFWPILIGGAIIAMAISLSIGMAQSVWFDEAYSILIAKQPIGQLINLTALDTHPPLFYLLLKFWAFVFGWSELALRSLPVIFMGGAVIFSGLLMKKLFDKRSAIITLPLVVLAPFLLRYGFEIRMYSLVSLIGVLSTYILINGIETNNKREKIVFFAFYALLVAIGVYTLYYSVLLWLAHLIWLIWRSKRNKESIIKSYWLWAYFASFVLFIPWLPIFISQITNGALAPIAMPMTIDNLLSIASFSLFYIPSWQLNILLFVVLLLVIALLILVTIKAIKISKQGQRQSLVLLSIYILVPIMILTIVGFVRPMYVERYLSHVLIGASLWVGASVSIVSLRSKKYIYLFYISLLFIMVVGIFQLSQTGNYNYQRSQTIDVKEAVSNIKCGDGEVVLAADPYEAIEASYYLSDCPIYFYSGSAKQIGGYSILSNSKMRVTLPAAQLADKTAIYFIRYSDLKLQMPSNLNLMYQHDFGKFSVDKYGVQ